MNAEAIENHLRQQANQPLTPAQIDNYNQLIDRWNDSNRQMMCDYPQDSALWQHLIDSNEQFRVKLLGEHARSQPQDEKT